MKFPHCGVPPKNLLTQPSFIRSQTCVRLWHMCMMWFPIFMHDYSYQIDMDLKRPKTLLTLIFLFFQGRMALLVTLFLVLVNIFNAITNNSPKADGLNALQVSKKYPFPLQKICENENVKSSFWFCLMILHLLRSLWLKMRKIRKL